MLSLHKTMYGVSPDGQHDFEIKGHFKLIGTHSTCTFKNASDGKDCEIEVKGDWIDRSAEMKWNGQVVASIARSFANVREILGGQQTVSSRTHEFDGQDLVRGMVLTLRCAVLRDGGAKR